MRFVDRLLAAIDGGSIVPDPTTTTPMRRDFFTRIEILHYTMGLIKTQEG
jgi:hypothetical protein